jgi:hypothetical protein
VRESAENQTTRIHPLSFTFPSPEAIYPMQLTGIGNGSLSVELYVFGPSRPAAKHFELVKCVEPIFVDEGRTWYAKPSDPFRVGYPLLKQWASGTCAAAKLTAKLTPQQMTDDVRLDWLPIRAKNQVLFSTRGAIIHAANWASVVLLACFLGGAALRWLKPAVPAAKLVCFSLSVPLLVGIVVWATLPTTSVQVISRSRMMRGPDYLLRQLSGFPIDRETPIGEVRAHLRQLKQAQGISSNWVNSLQAGELMEEDSPGNYRLLQTPEGVELYIYNAQGSPRLIEAFTNSPGTKTH